MTTRRADPSSPQTLPFELIRDDLDQVESPCATRSVPSTRPVEPYVSYVCNTAGKRIRPALAILAGGAARRITEDAVKLGVIIELIHMATLVHDDIIDGATTRRMVPTANAKWGNALAVLLGDALFSHALALATEFDDNHIARKVGRASREVCEGEIIQTQRRFDLTLTKADYFRIIEMKTGALFAAATGSRRLVSGAAPKTRHALNDFGLKLGTAYQIYDDCLDLVGTEANRRQNPPHRPRQGQTHPADAQPARERRARPSATKLNRRIIDQQPLDLPVLVGIAEYEGAIEAAIDTALDLLESAREDLEPLEHSPLPRRPRRHHPLPRPPRSKAAAADLRAPAASAPCRCSSPPLGTPTPALPTTHKFAQTRSHPHPASSRSAGQNPPVAIFSKDPPAPPSGESSESKKLVLQESPIFAPHLLNIVWFSL